MQTGNHHVIAIMSAASNSDGHVTEVDAGAAASAEAPHAAVADVVTGGGDDDGGDNGGGVGGGGGGGVGGGGGGEEDEADSSGEDEDADDDDVELGFVVDEAEVTAADVAGFDWPSYEDWDGGRLGGSPVRTQMLPPRRRAAWMGGGACTCACVRVRVSPAAAASPRASAGTQSWLNPAVLPPAALLACTACTAPLSLLAQLSAPLEAPPGAFHRSLYVFCCHNGPCVARGGYVRAWVRAGCSADHVS